MVSKANPHGVELTQVGGREFLISEAQLRDAAINLTECAIKAGDYAVIDDLPVVLQMIGAAPSPPPLHDTKREQQKASSVRWKERQEQRRLDK